MAAPLSNTQKRDLSILAGEAFAALRAKVLPLFHLELDGFFYDAGNRRADAQTTFLLRGDTASVNEWRHAEVAKACGKDGLRCCGQPEYNKVLAHFNKLLGRTAAAQHAMNRSASDGRRTAEYKILRVLADLGKTISYAEGISRRMFAQPLSECSDKQLWKIFFALNAQKKKGNAPAAPVAVR